jgi:hypothetical protein
VVDRTLSGSQVRSLRLRAQRLDGEPAADVLQVVSALIGIQAQLMPSPGLAVRARSAGLDAASLDDARNRRRSVVRTWGMRATLHIVASEDLGWLVGLLGPLAVASGRRRRLELNLDEEVCRKGTEAVRAILAARGPLTRDQLVDHLAGRGIVLEGQARPHLLSWAANHGVICLGPDAEGGEATYVLVEDWLGRLTTLAPERALAQLATRYLGAFGPATAHDFAAWAGIGIPLARSGFEQIAGRLREVTAMGQAAWMLSEPRVDPERRPSVRVRMVGHFDAYLLGYRSRDLVVAPRFVRRINSGGGFVQPAVLFDGRAVATWHQRRRGQRATILVEPFERLGPEVMPGLETEAADIGRFLGLEVDLALADPRPEGESGGRG